MQALAAAQLQIAQHQPSHSEAALLHQWLLQEPPLHAVPSLQLWQELRLARLLLLLLLLLHPCAALVSQLPAGPATTAILCEGPKLVSAPATHTHAHTPAYLCDWNAAGT